MATIKQFEANRRNAQHSTGPKTPEGKAAVSMNALRHGLRARTVVLPGEDPQEFHRLCDDLEVEWHPQSRTEQFYVEQMAVSQWKLVRMEVGEVNIFTNAESGKSQLPLLDRFWQAEARLERSFARAQHELERLQNSRRQPDRQPEEPAPQPAAEAESAPETTSATHPAATVGTATAATSEVVVGQAFSPVTEAAARSPRVAQPSEIRHPTSDI